MADLGTGYILQEPAIMTNKPGTLIGSDGVPLQWHCAMMDTTRAYIGSQSLMLFPGGRAEINYSPTAGAVDVSLRAWSPAVGTVRAFIINPVTGVVMDTVDNAQAGAWELLELSFTAEAVVYVIRLEHIGGAACATDNRAWIDYLRVG